MRRQEFRQSLLTSRCAIAVSSDNVVRLDLLNCCVDLLLTRLPERFL